MLASNLPRNSRPKLIRPTNEGREAQGFLSHEKEEHSERGELSHALKNASLPWPRSMVSEERFIVVLQKRNWFWCASCVGRT